MSTSPTAQPCLIVVSGLPSSGKSTIAKQLQGYLPYPLIAKDTLKELLFDSLGTGDRAWSKRLSGAAYTLLFSQTVDHLRLGHSCIIEGNFRWCDLHARFAELRAFEPHVVQLHCIADPAVLVDRFRQRASSRHAGHVDQASDEEITRELRESEQHPLPLPGTLVTCDTTNDWQSAMRVAVNTIVTQLRERELA
jgi:predicted kinase